MHCFSCQCGEKLDHLLMIDTYPNVLCWVSPKGVPDFPVLQLLHYQKAFTKHQL